MEAPFIYRLTFLGTGTSTGVPVIGCDCAVCQSIDPRDQRLRSSIMVETPTCRWIVDTGPDFRTQCLRARVHTLDAVLITHSHTDHIMGFDDLRRFTFGEDDFLPIYAGAETLAALARIYDFAFNGENRYAGYLKPDPQVVTGPFILGKTTVSPLPVHHGKVTTMGFHFAFENGATLAYIPDCKQIPPLTMTLLQGVDVLIVDALRLRQHPTHFNLAEALAAAAHCHAGEVWLTHLSHELSHATLESELPDNIKVAHDGLVLVVSIVDG